MRPPWEDPSRVSVGLIGAVGFSEGRDQPSVISTRWVRITASTTPSMRPLNQIPGTSSSLSAGRVGVAGSKFVASSESLPVQATFRAMCVHCAPAVIRSLRWEWMVIGNPPLDVTGTTRGHFVSRSRSGALTSPIQTTYLTPSALESSIFPSHPCSRLWLISTLKWAGRARFNI